MPRKELGSDHSMIGRIVLPAIATFVFFVLVLFLAVLPFIEARLMDQKRLQLKEMVALVCSDLEDHAAQVEDGTLSLEEAQRRAVEHTRTLRYGPEGKDYFHIMDTSPRMIMHPYRRDLEGQDITGGADDEGTPVTDLSLRAVEEKGEGFLEYRFQLKDDPGQMVSKLTYVRLFEPWDWIVATGAYATDVEKQLASTRRFLLRVCGAILLAVSLLCAYVVWESLNIDKRRRRAEERTRESEERYHSLFENASDAVMVLQGQTITMCNAQALEIYGCTEDELVGHTPFDLSPERQVDGSSSRDKGTAVISAALQGDPQHFDWQNCRPDGTVFDSEVRLNRVELDGEVCLLAAVRDVTERMRTRAALERFALVIEQAAEIVVITDTDGRTTYVNPAFERVTGYTRDEAIGQNPRILKSGQMDESFYRDLWETISSGGTWSGRFVNKKKDGVLFTEDATITPLRSSSGEIVSYVAVKRDVSRELELEEQFLQAQKMEAVGQLAGGVAHDFNNLLQVIQGCGELVLMDLDTDNRHYDALTQVMDAADRAKALVRQLLAFSRKQVLELEDVDLSEIVGNMSKMIQRIIGADIAFAIHSEPGVKRVRADRGQMDQILMNLCVNARDAMPEGGTLTIDTGIIDMDEDFCSTNSWAKPGRYAVLNVTDTGSGMDEETQRRVFEPFFTTKSLGKGTGLGLSTVFGIVRQHDGMVSVYSEVGVGTTFRVYLPLVEGDAAVGVEEEPAVVRGGTETILLADDDVAVCGVAEAILTRAGYSVLPTLDGEEAIRVFDEHADEIALALLDVVMPNLGGKTVADHIRAARPEVPVLFASGYSADAIHTNYVLDEDIHLVQKPYQRNELLRRVREMLDS